MEQFAECVGAAVDVTDHDVARAFQVRGHVSPSPCPPGCEACLARAGHLLCGAQCRPHPLCVGCLSGSADSIKRLLLLKFPILHDYYICASIALCTTQPVTLVVSKLILARYFNTGRTALSRALPLGSL